MGAPLLGLNLGGVLGGSGSTGVTATAGANVGLSLDFVGDLLKGVTDTVDTAVAAVGKSLHDIGFYMRLIGFRQGALRPDWWSFRHSQRNSNS